MYTFVRKSLLTAVDKILYETVREGLFTPKCDSYLERYFETFIILIWKL